MASLYDVGWRQGSVVDAELPVGGLVLNEHGEVQSRPGTHRYWVVASQDCDLNGWKTTETEPLVELRARVTVDDPDTEWGIRSRVLRLTHTEGVSAEIPPIRISPAALVAVTSAPTVIADERAVAFKTWLGRRYDRPAVPNHLAALAKDIATRAQRPSQRGFAAELHDVLMQFDERSTPPTFHLFAVLRDGADKDAARRWLTQTGIAVRENLGVLGSVQVGYRSETSLELIEDSYSADLSRLSWPGPQSHGTIGAN